MAKRATQTMGDNLDFAAVIGRADSIIAMAEHVGALLQAVNTNNSEQAVSFYSQATTLERIQAVVCLAQNDTETFLKPCPQRNCCVC